MRRTIACFVSLVLLLPGCATTGAIDRTVSESQWTSAQASMADYVQRLPVGSRVRVDLADGRRLRGTLMRANDTSVLLSPATRVPEPPVEFAVRDLRAVELDRSTGIGKVVAVGAAAGAAATLGVMLLLYALLGGD
jgi:hypothetical protein